MNHLLRRPLAVLGILFLVVIGTALLATYTGEPAYARQLHEKGEPATLADLAAWYTPVAPEENAALLYLRASAAFQALPPVEEPKPELSPEEEILWEEAPRTFEPLPIVGSGELPWNVGELEPALQERLRAYLALNEEALKLTYEAGRLRSSRFDLDFSKGPAMELEHLSRMRALARLLSLDAVRHVLDGNTDALTKTLEAQFRLAEAMAQEPVLISHLVYVAIFSIARGSLEMALDNASFTAAQLTTLQTVFAEMPDPFVSLKRAFVTERAFGLSYDPLDVTQFETHDEPRLLQWTSKWIRRATGATLGSEVVLTRAYAMLLDNAEKPPHTWEVDPMERQWEEVWRHSLIAAILLPSLSNSLEAPARVQADTALALTTLAIERYRRDNGQLPESLNALTPVYLAEMPVDPFSGQPPLYRREGEGYVVYSVGRDREDDGGTELNERGHRDIRQADQVFRIGLPREVETETR